MHRIFPSILIALLCAGCAKIRTGSDSSGASPDSDTTVAAVPQIPFDADSAFLFVKKQLDFGPRVPNTTAHAHAGDWMTAKLKQYGVNVTEQRADLKAFDGTTLHARNIFGQINPEVEERILLMAHYDSRPWADEDPDPAKRKLPVPGANDGASGVAVILEIMRQLQASGSKAGVDILFSDAEDWGDNGDDNSWALGTRHFVANPPIKGYRPSQVILLDMVGGKDALFPQEYFSVDADPALVAKIWDKAATLNLSDIFLNSPGGAVTDDHMEFIKAGIPAIDIIEYHPGKGFDPEWHTTADDLSNISPATLSAVGRTLLLHLSKN